MMPFGTTSLRAIESHESIVRGLETIPRENGERSRDSPRVCLGFVFALKGRYRTAQDRRDENPNLLLFTRNRDSHRPGQVFITPAQGNALIVHVIFLKSGRSRLNG